MRIDTNNCLLSLVVLCCLGFETGQTQEQTTNLPRLLDSLAEREVTLSQIASASSEGLNSRQRLRQPQVSLGGDLWTPLTLSIRTKQLVAATLLVKAGANVNLPTRAGYTALWLAAQKDSPESGLICELLLNSGADPTLTPLETIDGPFGENVLHLAARTCNLNLARQILERFPEANVPNAEGKLPLALVPRSHANSDKLRDILSHSTVGR